LSRSELYDKFRDCAARVLPEEQTERALALLNTVERLPHLGGLVEALIPG
jgi:hypothetical protein